MLNYAEDAGFKINLKKLEETLGIPIVVVDAREGTGLNELVRATIKAANHPKDCSSRLTYGFELDDHVNEVKGLFPNLKIGSAPDSWTAIKLLEGDDEVIDIAEKSSDKQNLQKVNNIRRHLEGILNDNVDDAFINARYAEIDSIMKNCVKKPGAGKKTLTDKIDDIVTNRILGIPIFLIVIYGVFQLTYTIGGPFQDLIDEAFTMLIDRLASSFVLNGVIGGVGSILTFIPIIFILFFLLSLIEDVGYLARAAFVIDRAMYKIMGLSGKAFIPMILGFGCDVTGIMATRTLANESDRISTMLALPFISCSARIPIYALFTAVFFVSNQAEITFGLYILGMIVAIIVVGIICKEDVFKIINIIILLLKQSLL